MITRKQKKNRLLTVAIISIAIHIVVLLVLGAIKVVEILKPEQVFEAAVIEIMTPPPPPPPPPPTTKRAQKSLPRPQPLAVRDPKNIDIPSIEIDKSALSLGAGIGIGGGFGELGGAVTESLKITEFGYDQAMAGTLEGTLFDFKQNSQGRPSTKIDRIKTEKSLYKYSKSFNIRELERDYYKADTALYASYFIIPKTAATIVPEAYGVQNTVQPKMIAVTYSGSYKPTESGRFRLVGRGDDTLVVRINGKIVLDASRPAADYSTWNQNSTQKRKDLAAAQGYFGFKASSGDPALRGDWFTLREGVETDVDVLIAEVPGGKFGAYLLIEEEGVSGLKIFSTRPLSDQDKEFIRGLHPDSSLFLS